jgi:hypothetical protein
MGQQQLLLLVMGVILVGIAVIAGFNAAAASYKQSIADTLVDRNLAIASHAVFWKTKLDPFNGGDASYTGLAAEGLGRLALEDSTETGYFRITRATPNELEITAVSLVYPEIGVRTLVQEYDVASTQISMEGTITIGE